VPSFLRVKTRIKYLRIKIHYPSDLIRPARIYYAAGRSRAVCDENNMCMRLLYYKSWSECAKEYYMYSRLIWTRSCSAHVTCTLYVTFLLVCGIFSLPLSL